MICASAASPRGLTVALLHRLGRGQKLEEVGVIARIDRLTVFPIPPEDRGRTTIPPRKRPSPNLDI